MIFTTAINAKPGAATIWPLRCVCKCNFRLICGLVRRKRSRLQRRKLFLFNEGAYSSLSFFIFFFLFFYFNLFFVTLFYFISKRAKKVPFASWYLGLGSCNVVTLFLFLHIIYCCNFLLQL